MERKRNDDKKCNTLKFTARQECKSLKIIVFCFDKKKKNIKIRVGSQIFLSLMMHFSIGTGLDRVRVTGSVLG